MLRFFLLLILFAILVRMIARFFLVRFIRRHAQAAPPPNRPESRFERIRDAEFEDVTDRT